MITIQVNNEEHICSKTTSVFQVLETSKVSLNGIAVALNEAIVPKNSWSTTYLNHLDNLLIIKATQGG